MSHWMYRRPSRDSRTLTDTEHSAMSKRANEMIAVLRTCPEYQFCTFPMKEVLHLC
jgi:hypothetical protein